MKMITDNAAQIIYDGSPTRTGFGLPLAKGVARAAEQLRLTLNNQALDCHVEPRGHWPDGSLRWCWVEAVTTQSGLLGLHLNQSQSQENPAQEQLTEENITRENTTRETFTIESKAPSAQPATPDGNPTLPTEEQSRISGQTLLCFLPLMGLTDTLDGQDAAALAASVSLQVQVTLAGQTQPMVLTQLRAKQRATPLSQTMTLTGVLTQQAHRLNLTANFQKCPKTREFSLTLRIHNPQAAKHSTGSWDLGDPGSCHIDKLALVWSLPNTKAALSLRTDEPTAAKDSATDGSQPYYIDGNFTLTQHGSGGENWQSPIHWDAQRRHPVKAQGFTLQHSQCHGNANVATTTAPSEGLRAQPTGMLYFPVSNATACNRLDISVCDFWQNFPMQLIGTTGGLRFELFPSTTELQGGESKTWHFSGQLHAAHPEDPSREAALASIKTHQRPSPCIRYHHAYLNSTGVFPHLRFSQNPNAISELIFRGLTGKMNFFEKREAADVYGWRHYGELYADHEAINCAPGEYFISHYNNQYDPLMGMTLQYLHWGELSWLKLIGPLAQHIKDIDIYDTNDDKAEYNGGLFWHTDHYLPAETSSHRSYSRHHTAVYEGHAGGGGPGGQHCYTTGLALQYWLFGDEQAKAKVLQLTRWIRAFYNGSGSVLDRAFRLLTIDFKQKQFTNIGIKAPGFRYPLDRGTGNYLIALLDAYDLTADADYVTEMASVIRQTVHPRDCLDERNLKDVENAWFYTVFLQAVARYLCLKESYQQIDDDYWYARHSFMTYLNWMRTEEGFYLDTPEKLEFPNDTWCAQEMRKANLFCFGWYFAADADPEYLTRAEAFYHYIEQRLAQSPEAEYTRILALLMQNDGVRQKFRSRPRSPVTWCDKHYGTQPSYNPKHIMATFFKDVLKLASQFSLQREAQWIKHRFPKLFR